MTLVESKVIKQYDDGHRMIDAFICSDSVPSKLPTSGAEVQGMGAKDEFAPMSIIYVADKDASTKIYIADENGTFVAQ